MMMSTDMLLLLVSMMGLVSIFSIVLYFAGFFHQSKDKKDDEMDQNDPQPIRRGGLAGLRQRRRQQQNEDENEENEDETYNHEPMTRKQIQKENKRKEREEIRRFEEQQREEQKKRMDAKEEAYRLKIEEREELELQKEEEEEKIRQEQERKEQEEFDKWKSMFSTDEEGSTVEKTTDAESQTLLEEFVAYIKKHKVVVLEDLASEFGLPTKEAVERVEKLQQMNRLSGITDDRGKFIYITSEEMEKVAQYIEKKGRITISDLASASNRFIKL